MKRPRDSAERSGASEGFLAALIGDGRPLLALTGLGLILAGAFALFLSATGSFLPQDVAFLGMDPRALCGINQCRVVHFMFHDRVSFGGTIIAIGTLYLWLVLFPLRRGQEWAWWAFVVSGAAGFASFLCYLGATAIWTPGTVWRPWACCRFMLGDCGRPARHCSWPADGMAVFVGSFLTA